MLLGLPIALGLVLAGCQPNDVAPVAETPVARKAAAPPADGPAAEARATMVEAFGTGANADSVPVDLRFTLPSAPVQGQPFQLEFGVIPRVPLVALTGRVVGGPGIVVGSPVEDVVLEKLQVGTLHRFTATLVGERPGTVTVAVELTTALPPESATRTFLVPVIIGAPARPAATARVPGA